VTRSHVNTRYAAAIREVNAAYGRLPESVRPDLAVEWQRLADEVEDHLDGEDYAAAPCAVED
jgi:hypothetical protein